MDMTSTDQLAQVLAGFKNYLLDCGAGVVGVADLSGLSFAHPDAYPRAVSIGLALRPDPILHLRSEKDRPAEADRPVLAALEELGRIAVQFLERCGAQAEILVPAAGPAALTHEEVAVQAGVAWIGKSGRPVTWDFGSAIRLTTVLTNADLPADKPVEQSFCGSCLMCTQACLVHAPSGNLWARGMRRADFVNEAACAERRQQLAALGRDCRFCMSVCPFTTVYLINSGLTVPTEGEEET